MKLFVEITSEEYEQLKDIHEWNKEKKLLKERNAFLEHQVRKFQEPFYSYSGLSFGAINRCLWAINEAQNRNEPLSKEKMIEIYTVLEYFLDIAGAEGLCL